MDTLKFLRTQVAQKKREIESAECKLSRLKNQLDDLFKLQTILGNRPKNSVTDAIYEVIAEGQKSLTEIIEKTNLHLDNPVPRSTIATILGRLVKQGRVVKVDRGIYKVNDQ